MSTRGGRGGRDRQPDAALHRTRGGGIVTNTRGAPKGPRNLQRDVRPGMQKALNSAMGMPQVSPMMPNGQPGMSMDAQQQMQLMAMMEQQARMMAQFMPGMMQQQQQGMPQQPSPSRSLFDRVEAGRGRGRGRGGRGGMNGSRNGSEQEDIKAEDGAPTSSMEVESSQPSPMGDPFSVMCRFNLRCTNKPCPFAHQSPVAPEGATQIDLTNTCTFGAACRNAKCNARHPSPSQIRAYQSEELCKFFPNCQNPMCTFKHPNMPMCRNGADCSVPHCKFTHTQTMCKFNPCLNAKCIYKHAEGQKGMPNGNKWVAPGLNEQQDDLGEHVSERKFVMEGEEELIKPEVAEMTMAVNEEVIT